MKKKNSKKLWLFDLFITIIIFLWMMANFYNGETVKGFIFLILFIVMIAVLSFKKRR
ncbi:uncharacterized membrane protein (DUF106 family) [Bacillus pakistanensis]|uniref:Uncharacterized membrane protein (DUF106 family) n=1 Tax=Rossellomorea pakistanensis TaxID=992288 RepID=A0ABS2NGN5_9BACI|nr:hypothetical protein [Bacillus pakistanensis]MBM7587026.1 uncharacterized membrane protein (DUF106 family) [Bacillus pakistanensis]